MSAASATEFNPYYKWLGISGVNSAPDHYRLLGIDLFESDAEVIAVAAERQMTHVRKYQTGRFAPYSQRVLNEIAAAKICLLDPQKKQDYDSVLRARERGDNSSIAVDLGINADTPSRRTNRGTRRWPLLLIAGCVGTSAIVALFLPWRRSDNSLLVGDPKLRETELIVERKHSNVGDTVPDSGSPKDGEVSRRPISVAEAAKGRSIQPRQMSANPRPLLVDLPPIGEKRNEEISLPSKNGAELNGLEELNNSFVRTLVPTRSELIEVRKKLKHFLAKKKKEKSLVGDDLRSLFDQEPYSDGGAARYALLLEIRDVAAANMDFDEVWGWTIQLIGEFQVADPSILETTAIKLAKNVRGNSVGQSRLLHSALEKMWKSIRDANFALAHEMAKALTVIAKSTGDREAIKWARGLPELVRRIEIRHKELEPFRKLLREEPGNVVANDSIGRYRCFDIGDFASGLALLAKGPSGELKKLANRELRRPTPMEKKSIADEWWDFSSQMPIDAADHIRDHVASLYRSSVFQIPAHERQQVWARLAQLAYSRPHFNPMISIVGTAWKVEWNDQAPWDRIAFFPDGKCLVVCQEKELLHFWQSANATVMVVNQDGTRTFSMTPVADSQVLCEKHNSISGQQMAKGIGRRLN